MKSFSRTLLSASFITAIAFAIGCVDKPRSGVSDPPPLPTAESEPKPASGSAESFRVQFETTKGNFVLEIHPEWAPHGAARFKQLVEENFFEDGRFFRVVRTPEPFVVQWGIHGDPKTAAKWRDQNLPIDPVRKSNRRGTITYAMGGAPTTRTTQVFINYRDNQQLDGMGFAPFGEVVEGMDVVDSLNGEYGELPSQQQQQIQMQGNDFLNRAFPNLDYIKSARILGGEKAGDAKTDDAQDKSAEGKAEAGNPTPAPSEDAAPGKP